jgi:hypothetical protein
MGMSVNVKALKKLVFSRVTGNRSSGSQSTKVRGYPTSAQSSERAILHSHPRAGREEWQTTRSLRLAELA